MNRNAFYVAVLSFVSRILTFVGRTLYIGKFGAAHPFLNAFVFALQVPQVLFNVVGTALSTIFIPVYNGLLAEEKKNDAKKFIDNVLSIALVLLILLALAGVWGAPWLARFVGGADFGGREYLTFALRVLLPAMVFFGVSAVFTGLLQSHGKFKLPALVSAPGGVLLIVYLVFFSERFGVTGLIYVTLLGGVLQPMLLLPAVWRLGYRYRFALNFKNEHIRAAGRLCLPVLVSVASYQAHFLFAHSMALRLGYAAVMEYAQQLVQVFIMLIVLAVAAVYFPRLSALWAKKEAVEYADNLRNAMVCTIFLVLPAAAGLILLRFEIMGVLLNWRGNSDTYRIAGNLMAIFAIGLVATSVKEIADRGFYAMKDSRTPAVFGVVIMAMNIGATLLLLPRLGIYAMPVAYGVAAVAGTSGLLVRLHRKAQVFNRKFAWDLVKIALACLMMAGSVWAWRYIFWGHNLFIIVVCTVFGAAGYLCFAFMLRVSVVREYLKREAARGAEEFKEKERKRWGLK
ncbi:MAG: polysaccharide biosynthesis C-terminal domain-containing protein [Defluviitaleaceae bacterium]|nr:polysaccharide biosynthesis C-terminal domain-containing protein [Defluviitaleaceae bacterium]MCL2273514.1 polysaccharide biosynthesis C-terminal domain-containing protein [Defluviitaleaceae bacterium]